MVRLSPPPLPSPLSLSPHLPLQTPRTGLHPCGRTYTGNAQGRTNSKHAHKTPQDPAHHSSNEKIAPTPETTPQNRTHFGNNTAGFSEFPTYEDYLDSQITEKDLNYLQDEELARQLVELGYRGSGEALKREEFEQRKREIEEMKYKAAHKAPKVLCSAGLSFEGHPFLKALAGILCFFLKFFCFLGCF